MPIDLETAVKNKDLDLIKKLCEKDNTEWKWGMSYASNFGDMELVRFFIENYDHGDYSFEMSISSAVGSENYEIAYFLYKKLQEKHPDSEWERLMNYGEEMDDDGYLNWYMENHKDEYDKEYQEAIEKNLKEYVNFAAEVVDGREEGRSYISVKSLEYDLEGRLYGYSLPRLKSILCPEEVLEMYRYGD